MGKRAWIFLIVITLILAALGVFLIITGASSSKDTDAETTSSNSKQFKSANVKVSSPLIEGIVAKSFMVIGEARGTWYFEASFPVQVRDQHNTVIAQSHAEAKADWMTEDWVPFTAVVDVSGYSGPATLVLLKDNPSGMPENDDSVEFPIVIR